MRLVEVVQFEGQPISDAGLAHDFAGNLQASVRAAFNRQADPVLPALESDGAEEAVVDELESLSEPVRFLGAEVRSDVRGETSCTQLDCRGDQFPSQSYAPACARPSTRIARWSAAGEPRTRLLFTTRSSQAAGSQPSGFAAMTVRVPGSSRRRHRGACPPGRDRQVTENAQH